MRKPNLENIKKKILIYDGDCILCNSTANFLYKRISDPEFLFIASESKEGNEYIEYFDLSSFVNETIVFIRENIVHIKSDALLEVINFMPPKYRFLKLMKVFPKSMRNGIYKTISKNRHLLN